MHKVAINVSNYHSTVLKKSNDIHNGGEVDKTLSLDNWVSYLNSQFHDTDEVLLWATKHFPKGNLIQLTSFGPSGLVLIHKLHKLGILGDIPVISIDTLHLFPQTYTFIKNVDATYGEMNLEIFRPRGFDNMVDFDLAHGYDLWQTNPDEYAQIAKVEPTVRAMDKMKPAAYITGRRSTQGGQRSKLNIFEVDNLDDTRLKINPLAHWSYDDIWSYIKDNGVMYNPLHDRGFKSIGDMMTTSPVAADADERSGRFAGLGKTECGIHSVNRPKKVKNNDEDSSCGKGMNNYAECKML